MNSCPAQIPASPAVPEVIHDNVDKVFIRPDHEAPEVYRMYVDKEAVSRCEEGVFGRLRIGSKPIWKRKSVWIIMGICALGVLVGGIVGAVIASRKTTSSPADEATSPSSDDDSTVSMPPISSTPSTPSPKPTSSISSVGPVPTSIATRSFLSAVAFKDDETKQNTILLGYKNPDEDLVIARYSANEKNVGSPWGQPRVVQDMESGFVPTMGASMSVYMNESIHVEISYPDNRIGKTFSSSVEDSEFKFVAPNVKQGFILANTTGESAMSAYGSSLLYQEPDGMLAYRTRNEAIPGFAYMYSWLTYTKPTNGTTLALLPMSTNYTKVMAHSAVGIIYQDTEGKLRASNYNLDQGYNAVPKSWPVEFPDIELHNRASFAGFSVARSDDDEDDLVNSFILYQDKSMDIKQVWADEDKQWHMSSPQALRGADPGTGISCTSLEVLRKDGSRKLGKASEFTRCYFRRDEYVVEAQLNGTDWVILGNVPLP